MLIFNKLKEMKPFYIKEINTYVFKCDIKIKFPLVVGASINAWDINAGHINARDINAGHINAWDIDAWNINAGHINAKNINADDINTKKIDARDIEYWGVCIARESFRCRSIKGRRENSIHKCLDQEIEFIKD